MNICQKIIYATLALSIIISNANGGREVKENLEITEQVVLDIAECGKQACRELSDTHYVDFHRKTLKFHQLKEHLKPYYHRQFKSFKKCHVFNCECLTYCSLSCSEVDFLIKKIDSYIEHLKVYLQGLEEKQKFIGQPVPLIDSTDTQSIGTALVYSDIEDTAKNYNISQLEAASYLIKNTKNKIKEKENFITYYIKKKHGRVTNYIRVKKFKKRLYATLRKKYPQYFYKETYQPIPIFKKTIENIFPE